MLTSGTVRKLLRKNKAIWKVSMSTEGRRGKVVENENEIEKRMIRVASLNKNVFCYRKPVEFL